MDHPQANQRPRRHLMIMPRLTLPSKELIARVDTLPLPDAMQLTKKTKRRRWNTVLAIVQQCLYLMIAAELCIMDYIGFSAWPIYRVVSFVIIIILWSNVASGTARRNAKEQALLLITTMQHKAVRWSSKEKPAQSSMASMLTEDTTAYLRAIRAGFVEGQETCAIPKISNLYDTIPCNVPDHSIVIPPPPPYVQ